MSAVGIVPARWASTRFPGKPLAAIAGRPMIQHVIEGTRGAKSLREVFVATDDERIAEVCRDFDAPVLWTRSDHPTGSDRLAEASEGLEDDVIVNVQGDEPLVEGFVVDAAVDALAGAPEASMSTLVHRAAADALDDPNRVKVVLDREGNALYFSRARIPYPRNEGAPVWQHVGLYAYRRAFLATFVALPPTPLERTEGLEQLRALEHGHRIRAAVIDGWESVPVDVPDDVARVESRLRARTER